MGKYGPPVDQFLNRLEQPRLMPDWPDYLAEGFGPEQIPDLIRMATDPELNEGDSESLEVWAPVHAWRTLGQLRAESAVGPLIEMLAGRSEAGSDDWASEELPIVLGMIGPAALPGARALLEDESIVHYAKTAAGRVLEEAGKRHPEARDECVAILSRGLERAESNQPFVNGFLVGNLLDLRANEAAGVIERAYAGGFVDDTIVGTWYEVWHELDLEGEPPPETERQFSLFGGPRGTSPAMPSLPRQPRDSPEPIASRTPEQRKDRNKARQKLEKKVKGKKSKKR
jgi:Protein of unknown function (DUF1186)